MFSRLSERLLAIFGRANICHVGGGRALMKLCKARLHIKETGQVRVDSDPLLPAQIRLDPFVVPDVICPGRITQCVISSRFTGLLPLAL